MHLRGKSFEYNITRADHCIESLLRVHYHFHWQMSYRLATPMPLKSRHPAASRRAIRQLSRQSPHPHPDAEVRWGEQTSDEMMVGFFDVAVDPTFDKQRFFQRATPVGASH